VWTETPVVAHLHYTLLISPFYDVVTSVSISDGIFV